MSHEHPSTELSPLSDPGVPPHVHRRADHEPRMEKKAERQVAILFSIGALSVIGFVAAFVGIDNNVYIFIPIFGSTHAQQLALGMALAVGLFAIGAGAVHWAKTLMPDEEIIQERHDLTTSPEDRAEMLETFRAGAAAAGLGRRSLIKRSLAAALGLFGIVPVILLRDLGPLPKKALETTNWKAGRRLITDPGGVVLKASDLQVGSVAHVLPQLPEGEEHTLKDLNKDAVIVLRLRPEDFDLPGDRLTWTHEGIIAFSKICSHMGCAVGLYEQQTHHLLCPCHQSTFDVTRAAKVIFGPAARPLPQLAITVDSEGYLIAKDGFDQPVGPSFWERSS